jgi:Family of unknown function (DUF6412)
MLADLIRSAGLWQPAAHALLVPSVLPAALTATVVAVVLTACVAACARSQRTVLALPLIRLRLALRDKSWRAAFTRQADPDADGRPRPRAPAAAPAAA